MSTSNSLCFKKFPKYNKLFHILNFNFKPSYIHYIHTYISLCSCAYYYYTFLCFRQSTALFKHLHIHIARTYDTQSADRTTSSLHATLDGATSSGALANSSSGGQRGVARARLVIPVGARRHAAASVAASPARPLA